MTENPTTHEPDDVEGHGLRRAEGTDDLRRVDGGDDDVEAHVQPKRDRIDRREAR